MSLKYKFDKLNENKEQEGDASPSDDIEKYEVPSHTRALSFIDTSGNHYFLNYAYLVSGEYKPSDNAITLFFTSHSVTIKGANLEGLFNELIDNRIKQVKTVDKRYASALIDTEPIVTDIQIKERE